jgi:threonine dehydrogenase-like Zn-dependent dehydrogenase
MEINKMTMCNTVKGVILPGNGTVEFTELEIPSPSYGEVIVQTKSSTICGSDIRCIYKEHLGKGPEGYQSGLVCGHEACGVITECGPGMRRFKVGDRVIIYHISGCGMCHDCRKGYMNCCTNEKFRRAYGWQRNGGMAPFVLAEEKVIL